MQCLDPCNDSGDSGPGHRERDCLNDVVVGILTQREVSVVIPPSMKPVVGIGSTTDSPGWFTFDLGHFQKGLGKFLKLELILVSKGIIKNNSESVVYVRLLVARTAVHQRNQRPLCTGESGQLVEIAHLKLQLF